MSYFSKSKLRLPEYKPFLTRKHELILLPNPLHLHLLYILTQMLLNGDWCTEICDPFFPDDHCPIKPSEKNKNKNIAMKFLALGVLTLA